MAEEAKYRLKNRITIIVLVLVFVLPVVVAWYLVFFTEEFRNGETGEHGYLIEPPRQLPDTQLSGAPTGASQNLHGKWTLIALASGKCGESCRENLYRMQQIRLATGKDMHRLQRVLLHNGLNDETADIASDYPGQLFLSLQEVSREFETAFFQEHDSGDPGIFLVDTRGYLMMYYPYETDPPGVIKDLKRLLRVSRDE